MPMNLLIHCDSIFLFSSASPDEAVSWGKIRRDAKPVKLCAEATLVVPLLVAETFAKHFEPKEKKD